MKSKAANMRPALALLAVLVLGARLLTASAQGVGVTNFSVVAWGYNSQGQTNVPLGWNSVAAAAAGASQSLALQGSGTSAGWGWNFYGQTTIPADLNRVAAVAAGYAHAVVLQTDGTVAAWGWNGLGQTSVPADFSNATAVAAGGYHSVALKNDGSVIAWGYNGFGQASVPSNLSNVTAVAAGGYHSLALKGDGTVVAWGAGATNNPGDWVDYGQSMVPPGVSNVIAVAAGGYHSLALKSDGTVVAWGWNFFGQSTVPPGLSNVAAVAAGYAHSLALKGDGTVIAWGDNSRGQTSVPPGLSNIVALAPGPMANHILAVQKQVVSLPALTATRSGSAVVISWPSSFTNWSLQQNSNLSQANWATNNYAISDNGTNKSITISSPTANLFFRLQQSLAVPPASNGPPANFYVAADGNDAWSGTLPSPNTNNSDGPFASFDRARGAVQALNKISLNQVTVQFCAGTYFLPATETFTVADSGTTNTQIIYQNYPGEAPVISGGRLITNWTASGTVSGAWQASVAGFASFEQLWVNGQRRYRVRAPTSNSSNYFYNLGPIYVTCSCGCSNANYGTGYSPAFLVTSGPHAGQYECFDRFFFSNGDINPAWSGLADTNHPIEVIDFEDWTIARMRLQSVGPSSVYTNAPSNSSVAYLVGPTAEGQYWGFLQGHRYLVDNVKDALSSSTPGQWYVDLDAAGNPNMITYVPATGENFSNNPPAVVAPQLNQLLQANDRRGFRYVTFKGLTFSHANWVAGIPGYSTYSGSQNTKGALVPAALSFTNASHVTLDSIVVSQVGGWGAEFMGIDPQFTAPSGPSSSYDNQIINSEFNDLGSGAIRLGTQPASTDTDANVAQYNLIYNNVLAGGDRMVPGVAIWIGSSHHNVIDHNDIYDFYNQAINLGAGLNFDANGFPNWAHDNQITFNHIYELGEGVTSDMGCVHTATALATGNVIANNRFHDVTHDPGTGGYGGWGIYLDQGSSFLIVTNNLVYNTSATGFTYNHSQSGTYQLNGTPNAIQNNIFAFGTQASIHRNGDDGALNFTFKNNLVYWDQAQPISGPPSPLIGTWTCGGAITTVTNCFELATNLYYSTVDPNMATWRFTLGGGHSYTLAQWQARPSPAEDFGSTVNVDPMFVCPNNVPCPSSSAYNFNLQPNSPAPSLVGFQPFNPSQAGRANPLFLPPALPPAFPLQLLGSY